jgi:hypothetical protein
MTEENRFTEIEKKTKELYDALPLEHREILENYNKKLSEILQGFATLDPYEHLDNEEPLDLSKKHPEILHPKHLTDAPHEIVAYLKIEVSNLDNNGNLNEIKDLCEQYYHIPIPAGVDYNLYVSKFFEKFHSNLELSCQEVVAEHKDV